jgi:AraC-like DNA-binding protein
MAGHKSITVSGEFTEIRGTAHDLQGWHELLTGDEPPFHRIEAVRDGDGFAGRLRRIILDQVAANVVEIEASQHVISRTAEHLKFPPSPYYLVHFQLRGSSVFRQLGLASALRAGDFVVTSGSDPYSWEFRDDFSTFSMRFPQSFVNLPETALRPVLGRPVPALSRFGSRLSPFVAAVTTEDGLLWGPLGARVARNLIDLIATALCEAVADAPLPRSVLSFMKITENISRRLSEPGLDTAAVARAHHLSARHLQAVFAEQGTTVTSWIRERRLAGCRRDLADPALRDLPIGDIAARWGYRDQAYFSRLFRRSFGETPREWRARAMESLSGRGWTDLVR